MLVPGVWESDSICEYVYIFQFLFPYRLLRNTEHSSLRCTVTSLLSISQQCVCVIPNKSFIKIIITNETRLTEGEDVSLQGLL